MTHSYLLDAAKEAINAVFSDRSVDRSQVIDSLQDLQNLVDSSLEALENDQAAEEDNEN